MKKEQKGKPEQKGKLEQKEAKDQSTQSFKGDVSKAVDWKMKYLLGTEELKPCKLPKTRPEEPFEIKEKSGSLITINCPYFGSLTEGENGQDKVKNLLRIAEVNKCDAILISELLFMITQGWGKLRPYLTRVSGIKIDADEIEAGYPESVRKDERYEPVAKRMEKGEPAFVSPAQRLAQIFRLMRQSFVNEKGKPVYSGPVYVTLGRLEDEVISFFTNEWVRIRFFRSRAYADKKIAELKGLLKKSKSEKLEHELDDWLLWRDIWLLMKNISDYSTNQAREMITGFFVKKIEEAIPNAKVVGVGNTFYEHGSRLIMVTADKDRVNIQGNQAKNLKKKTQGFSKGRNPEKIPDLILGMGPNPVLAKCFNTYQASSDPADKRISLIVQLPMCIDAFQYRDVVRGSSVLKDPITRVVGQSGFESGGVMFTWYKHLFKPVVDSYGSRLLNNPDVFRNEKSLADMVHGMKLEYLKTYLFVQGDEHCGAGEVIMHRCPGDAMAPRKFNWQVTLQFNMDVHAPIVAYLGTGDHIHGQNWQYATKYEGANRKTPLENLEELNAIQFDKNLSPAERLAKVVHTSFKRDVREGIHSPDKQVKEYVKSLKPYIGFFVEILRRNKKTGVRFDGTLTPILYIMGNHIKNTYKNAPVIVSDALQIVERLKKEMLAYLIKHPADGVTPEDVEKGLSAPQDGYVGEARGSIGVGDKESFFAIMLKHKQGDTSTGQKRSYNRTVEGEEVGLPILNVHGDKHMCETRVARDLVDVLAGCSLGLGVFGRDIDGNYQDVCSVVCGLPVGGLKCGPVRFIFLDEETMREYAANPFKIDDNQVFANALK